MPDAATNANLRHGLTLGGGLKLSISCAASSLRRSRQLLLNNLAKRRIIQCSTQIVAIDEKAGRPGDAKTHAFLAIFFHRSGLRSRIQAFIELDWIQLQSTSLRFELIHIQLFAVE